VPHARHRIAEQRPSRRARVRGRRSSNWLQPWSKGALGVSRDRRHWSGAGPIRKSPSCRAEST
jgi:hypothetical protein